jgi:hypothetical protein
MIDGREPIKSSGRRPLESESHTRPTSEIKQYSRRQLSETRSGAYGEFFDSLRLELPVIALALTS